uniref:Uncharacterized protein n=1 Tax=Magallana gigas TaxID=29159 RepID=K1RE21_MAGGI
MEDPEDMISVLRDILKVKAETDRNSPTMPLNTDLATKETTFLGPFLRPDSMVTIQPRINVNLVPVLVNGVGIISSSALWFASSIHQMPSRHQQNT